MLWLWYNDFVRRKMVTQEKIKRIGKKVKEQKNTKPKEEYHPVTIAELGGIDR